MPRHYSSTQGQFNPRLAGILAMGANRTFSPASISTMLANLEQPGSAIFQPEMARGTRLRNDLLQSQIRNSQTDRKLATESNLLEKNKFKTETELAEERLSVTSSLGKEKNAISKIRALADVIRAKSDSRKDQPGTETTLRAILGDELYESTKDQGFSVDQAIGVKRSKNVGRELNQRQDRLDFDLDRSGAIRSEKDRRQSLRESEADRKMSKLALEIDDLMRDNKIDQQTGATLKQLMSQSAEVRGAPQAQPEFAPPTPQERKQIEEEAMQLIEADPQYDGASTAEKRRAARPLAVDIFKQSRRGR